MTEAWLLNTDPSNWKIHVGGPKGYTHPPEYQRQPWHGLPSSAGTPNPTELAQGDLLIIRVTGGNGVRAIWTFEEARWVKDQSIVPIEWRRRNSKIRDFEWILYCSPYPVRQLPHDIQENWNSSPNIDSISITGTAKKGQTVIEPYISFLLDSSIPENAKERLREASSSEPMPNRCSTENGKIISDSTVNNVSSKEQRLIEQISQELTNKQYSEERVAQGLFLTALDLKLHLENEENQGADWIRDAVEQAYNSHGDWVRRGVESADLPEGFTDDLSQENVNIPDFDDPRVDHEFLLLPGRTFSEVIASDYYELICEDRSLQSLLRKSRADKNLVRDVALIIIGQMGTAGISMIPVVCVFALHLLEQNIDEVCENAHPH